MSINAKVTRFGADPLLNFELANKQYVDSIALGIGGLFFNGYGVTVTVTGWFWLSGWYSLSTTEIFRTTLFAQSTRLQDFYFRTSINSRNEAVTMSIRVNEADSGITVSIPASTTGIFSDLVNTKNVVAGDSGSMQYNQGSSSTGSMVVNTYGLGYAS